MRTLFVAGPGRSGTTAFANYLNQHEAILLCRERYKFVPRKITPDFFDFDRILEHKAEETNLPRAYHANLLAGKDRSRLRWIGDKTPNHVRHLRALHNNNPGSRFIILYRPIEEVAESYQARSRNPRDKWLGGKNGFEIGVRYWNDALQKTRDFVGSGAGAEVLVVSYHDFFSRNEDCIPLISKFLDLEFDETVREEWWRRSEEFEEDRRDKEPLTDEQLAYVRDNKDYAAEEWTLRRIQQQWEDLDSAGDESVSIVRDQLEELYSSAGRALLGGHYRTEDASAQQTEDARKKLEASQQQVKSLKSRLAQERQKSQRLGRRMQRLERQIRHIKSSRTWWLMRRLDGVKSRLSRGGKGK